MDRRNGLAGIGKGDVTLARWMQEGGYRTIHVGAGHLGARI
jgi:arylsulfatase A-like enzyme